MDGVITMNNKEVEYSDPLIDEVRQRRKELFALYQNDLSKLYEAIKQRQAKYPEKIIDHRKLKPLAPKA
jgi:hypothetical protein